MAPLQVNVGATNNNQASGKDAKVNDPSGNEKLAYMTVAAARKAAATAFQGLRSAEKTAAEANRAATLAESHLKSKESFLQQHGPRLGPEGLATLVRNVTTLKALATQLRQVADKAAGNLNEAEQKAVFAEHRQEELEKTANRVLKAIGKGEPFQAGRKDRDGFESGLKSSLFNLSAKDAAKLFAKQPKLNARQAAAFDSKRIAVATGAQAANGALTLEDFLTANADPSYRHELIAEIQAELTQMGVELSTVAEEGSAEEKEEAEGKAHEAFGSLTRSSERLTREEARCMADAFARGILEEQFAQDPGVLAARLKEVLTDGKSGALFAMQLAAALKESGKATASAEVLKAVAQALDEVRARYERAVRKARTLNRKMAKLVKRFGGKMTPAQLEQALADFKEQHVFEFAQHERAAGELGALMRGAALAVERSEESPSDDTTRQLTEQSLLTLAHVQELAQTEAGQKLIGEALDAQARGEKTFLDALPKAAVELAEVAERDPLMLARAGLEQEPFKDGGNPFLSGVGKALAQALAPQLVALRCADRHQVALKLVKAAVTHNTALFGLSRRQLTRVGEAFGKLTSARHGNILVDAISDFADMSGGLEARPGSSEQIGALKALAMVMATGIYATNVSVSRGEDLASALRVSTRVLDLGMDSLSVLTSMLRPLIPTPAVEQELRQGGSGVAGTKMLVKVGGALRSVSSGVARITTPAQETEADLVEFASGVSASLAVLPCGALADAMASLLFPQAPGAGVAGEVEADADLEIFQTAAGEAPSTTPEGRPNRSVAAA